MRIRIGVAAAAVVALLALAVVVVVVVARHHVPATPASLGRSVARAAGTTTTGPCTAARVDDHLAPGLWDCGVWVDYGSSGTGYRVRIVDGASCWSASGGQVVEGRSELPARISGCVQRRD